MNTNNSISEIQFATLQIIEVGSHEDETYEADQVYKSPYFFDCTYEGDYIFTFENMRQVRDFNYWEWMTDDEVVEVVDREKFEKFVDAYNGDCLKTFAENLMYPLVVRK